MSPRPPDEQPELLPGLVRATLKESQAKARETRSRRAAEAVITEVDPVARVLVDVPLAHLDRPFDYAVPEGTDPVGVRRVAAQTPAAALRASARSVRSQVNSGSSRPKWP